MPKDSLNTSGSLPERSIGFSNGDGRSLPEGEGDCPSPLDQRLRTGGDAFQFDALINGVSTLDQPPLQDPLYANSTPDSVGWTESSSPPVNDGQGKVAGLNRTVLVSVLTSVCVAALTVFFLTHRPTVLAIGQAPSPASADLPLADVANTFTRRGMPDPSLSPGAFSSGSLPKGAAAAVALPDTVQKDILTSYRIAPNDKRFLVCYVVPPTLGGTNNAKNLFPATPWFRGLKQRLDAHLTNLVHNKKMSLAQARQELMSDWIQSVHRHPVRNYGFNDSKQAKKVEKNTIWGK